MPIYNMGISTGTAGLGASDSLQWDSDTDTMLLAGQPTIGGHNTGLQLDSGGAFGIFVPCGCEMCVKGLEWLRSLHSKDGWLRPILISDDWRWAGVAWEHRCTSKGDELDPAGRGGCMGHS